VVDCTISGQLHGEAGQESLCHVDGGERQNEPLFILDGERQGLYSPMLYPGLIYWVGILLSLRFYGFPGRKFFFKVPPGFCGSVVNGWFVVMQGDRHRHPQDWPHYKHKDYNRWSINDKNSLWLSESAYLWHLRAAAGAKH